MAAEPGEALARRFRWGRSGLAAPGDPGYTARGIDRAERIEPRGPGAGARRFRLGDLDTPGPDWLGSPDLSLAADAEPPLPSCGFENVLETKTEVDRGWARRDPRPSCRHWRGATMGRAVSSGLICGLVLCLGQAAMGQDPPPAGGTADALAGVRQKTTFTSAEDDIIDDWVGARMAQLRAGVDAASDEGVEAASEFREAFAAEQRNAQSTPRYLDRLAERVAAVAVVEFGKTDDAALLVHASLAWVLLDINRASARSALDAGLRHPQATVRYLCARAYAGLRDSLAADAATTRAVIILLKTTGTGESSGVVLGALYEALAYEDARHVGLVVPALAEVFAARVAARQAGQIVRTDRAELAAFYYLDRVRNGIDQAARPALVRQLAACLALDVQRHASAIPEERIILEERIEICESLIEALAGGVGGVRAAMKAGGDSVEEEMGLELLKWVGGEGVQGTLNAAPWSVPSGGLPAAP